MSCGMIVQPHYLWSYLKSNSSTCSLATLAQGAQRDIPLLVLLRRLIFTLHRED